MMATTSTTVAYGTSITTGGVQVLPEWAPPIQYIGTTTPWNVIAWSATTGDVVADASGRARRLHVRTYGRRATLYSGAECVAVRDRIEAGSTKRPMLVITYRALGEVVRP
jgi:hypothetical protein